MACDLSNAEVGDYVETTSGSFHCVVSVKGEEVVSDVIFKEDGATTWVGIDAVALHKTKPQFMPDGWRVENGWLISDKCSVKLFDGEMCIVINDARDSYVPSWCTHALLCREDVDAEYERHLRNKRRLEWKIIGCNIYEAIAEECAYLVYPRIGGTFQARVSNGLGTTALGIHASTDLAREACQRHEDSLHTK